MNLAPGTKAFGASSKVPSALERFLFATAPRRSPPFDGTHVSVWSAIVNWFGLPSSDRAEDVRGAIRPLCGNRIRVSITSTPGYSQRRCSDDIISFIGSKAFRVCSSETASRVISTFRSAFQGCPTGRPFESHPAKRHGPRASKAAIAARNGLFPHPFGRCITPRRYTRSPVMGSMRYQRRMNSACSRVGRNGSSHVTVGRDKYVSIHSRAIYPRVGTSPLYRGLNPARTGALANVSSMPGYASNRSSP